MERQFTVIEKLVAESESLLQQAEVCLHHSVEWFARGLEDQANKVFLRALELETLAHGKMSAADLLSLGGKAEAERWLDLAEHARKEGREEMAECYLERAAKLG